MLGYLRARARSEAAVRAGRGDRPARGLHWHGRAVTVLRPETPDGIRCGWGGAGGGGRGPPARRGGRAPRARSLHRGRQATGYYISYLFKIKSYIGRH